MKLSRKQTSVLSLVALVALGSGLYWQVQRLQSQRQATAMRAQLERERIDTIANIDAAKAAFGRVLSDVGKTVERAVRGPFTFGKADSDTLRVLHQLLIDKPAPRCFGPARLASLNAVEAASRLFTATIVDAPPETVTEEDQERAQAVAQSAPGVAAAITAAQQTVESACSDWLREHAKPRT
jgi:hypothetical protein